MLTVLGNIIYRTCATLPDTRLHYSTQHYSTLYYTKLHYSTQRYSTLHYTTLPYTTHTTLSTLHYNCNYTTTTTTTALHHTTSSSCWWGDHCNYCNHSKNQNSNHLSAHQWIGSAIRNSRQPTSPIGFLFLKFPSPPCAVLLKLINMKK